MEFEIGIVCGQCDTYSPMNTSACPACGHDLSLFPAKVSPSKSGRPRFTTNPGSKLAKMSMGSPAPAEPTDEAAPATIRQRSVVEEGSDTRNSPAAGSGGDVDVSADKSDQSLVESPYARLTQEELMEQARHYVCKSCSTPVPQGHKFCGRCGESVPPEILTARTMFFSDMQNPAKAKLILIRGEGMDGLSFHLKADQHVVGRNGQLVFPDDPFISPRHANFFYRDGRLVVRDEGSLNGVYLRVRGTVEVQPGDQFLAGEQLFRLDLTPRASDGPEQDGTYFYSSPKHPSPFRITQMLQGGLPGMIVCARAHALQIGREGADLNFPGDLFMSGSHCRIEEVSGKFTITDLNSRNGTYIRLKTERELGHGDYLFIGRKLLRVELNSN
jgi:pSer/pThr/pTyr-binding forkhead associated (FHA) protein